MSRSTPAGATRSSTPRARFAPQCNRSRNGRTRRPSSASSTRRRLCSTTSDGSRCARARWSVADPYAFNRVTGAFILIDEGSNDTVAAGTIRTARAVRARARASPRRNLALVRTRPRRALAGDRPTRSDGSADGVVGLGKVDNRGGARAPTRRQRPVGLPARR